MSTFTTHDGVELEYRDRGGNGFPLVMLHGWGQTQSMFRHQLSDLAPDRRVITLDLRGHGLSAKPHFGYRIARFSRDVWELLDHLELDQVDALGWSMGVSVWWSFIDQYGTDRIRRFIAVDQPSAVAAVPWMSAEEQAESGAIFDVAALGRSAKICMAPMASPLETASSAACSAATRQTPRSSPSSWPNWTPFPHMSACRSCSTTARRIGATCSPASTCQHW